MKFTDTNFVEAMSNAFDDGLREALAENSEVFAFPYEGVNQPDQAAACAANMTCVVLLLPMEVADLMIEGLPVVRENLTRILSQVPIAATPGSVSEKTE